MYWKLILISPRCVLFVTIFNPTFNNPALTQIELSRRWRVYLCVNQCRVSLTHILIITYGRIYCVSISLVLSLTHILIISCHWQNDDRFIPLSNQTVAIIDITDVGFCPKVARLAPNGTYPGLFQIRFNYKSDLKESMICPIWGQTDPLRGQTWHTCMTPGC